ncbi:tRNA (N(6)-L-threonylcarbamoyladenosine(37)-C(2))-methylthiotransferase MtaB [Ruminococcus champanellensis]|uniref:tRNA (N(6)-L-threonylcarbamoyladenosine(37)-C(2))- methylthiotransferase MtaB n=1 Tax=Ruminococcus champanellensis TaxID=1161942 RepID=UPI0023F53DEE|nr:tRNA (N(6)-L-threonylcarbamoyladenosine(37)-C(2))-methylthiotransferase MtaB [Ruminococcus champanellensis]
MTAYYLSFGCKVNQYETNALRGMLSQEGIQPVEQPEDADLILVNSCTVTASSDRKVRHALRSLRSRCPKAKIVLTGCLPQAHPDAAQLCPEADLITGTKDRATLIQRIRQLMESAVPWDGVTPYTPGEGYELLPPAENADRTRAFIKIQDGCNQFCSYCIIPYARGRCRSKPREALAQEAAQMAQAGCREAVLIGINLAFYGMEWQGDLGDAVDICCAVPGIDRVRLGSLEPEKLSDDLLRRLAAHPQFCPQFHLSLQSGCDRTLRAMNRHYTTAEYADLAARIRQIFPDAALTTDVMVGFPGETEADFARSLEFVREMGFAKVHVFPYSPREGTVAARMPEQIPSPEKRRRAALMGETAAASRRAFLRSQVGKVMPVLFERSADPAWHRGYTPNYTPVKISAKKGEKSLRKSVFRVIIKSSEPDCCIGTLLPEASAQND